MKPQDNEQTWLQRRTEKIRDRKHFVRGQWIKAVILIAFMVTVAVLIFLSNVGG